MFDYEVQVQVAPFGLSAIDVSSSGLIAIGSESGEIFLYHKKDEILEIVQRVSYHSCTVTGMLKKSAFINLFPDVKFEGTSRLVSVSLDCRLAVYTISEVSHL